MDKFSFHMRITSARNDSYIIQISNENDAVALQYNTSSKTIIFPESSSELNTFLKEREFQLYRILNNKRRDTFYKGFSLNFILHANNPGQEKFNKQKLTVINRKNKKEQIYKKDNKTPGIPEIYTDGAYIQSNKRGGYSVLIKKPGKPNKLNTYKTKNLKSNTIELQAIIKGIKHIKGHKEVRIITDSQYVIKGISEWIINWRLNNWKTANGDKVKDKKRWQILWRLMKNKHIELQWVKSHAENAENKLCDFHSRYAARQKNKK